MFADEYLFQFLKKGGRAEPRCGRCAGAAVRLAATLLLFAGGDLLGGDPAFSDPARRPAFPAGASGYPLRDAAFDVQPGFVNPPPGYGEVPFWWWTGDQLNAERMIGQIKELHKKGISGVQVNYSHFDTAGWMTDQDQPEIFTEEWWKIYSQISAACGKLNMGIGLSTYTLDWPRGAKNLFYQLFYRKAELNAIELQQGRKLRLSSGKTGSIPCEKDQFAAYAYPIRNNIPQPGGVDLSALVKDDQITWSAPEGEWEIWTFRAVRKAGSLNPLMEGAGETVIKGFFQPFQDRNPGQSAEGLNYFFNDELHIGVEKFAWNSDFLKEFKARKGYALSDHLPAMWIDAGDLTPKVRMDYADVRMSLMEERYFKPIYNWHAARGMIFACDSGGRGKSPNEFGDYFRVTRWYSAPGHDTPGGRADLIKGKVSSSIASLYQQPRVWLEGYHSLGWGAAPENLMFATRENYLYGCTLLNLHGLYYTTYGSHWEWAPPCYHFRMPYWDHMGVFLKYFDRLSFLMSQGQHRCDVALLYPVAPYEADLDGGKATKITFETAQRLMAAGINFDFIDNDSLARAEVVDGRLTVKAAGAAYQALVFAGMEAVRQASIGKAAAFAKAGGLVVAVAPLPAVSDHAGRNDPWLSALTDQAFKQECRTENPEQAVALIRAAFVQDVRGVDGTVRALHRKVGPRDIYLVMDAKPGSQVDFRAVGAVELWDPWTGGSRPLRVISANAGTTRVELPLESYEAQIVVFTPGQAHRDPPAAAAQPLRQIVLPSEGWSVSFVPTMDNGYGDFRLPVTAANKMIGVEARVFEWAREVTPAASGVAAIKTEWSRKLHGYGTQFYLLGPIPDDADLSQLEQQLAALQSVDPAVPVTSGDLSLSWQPYDFSWRYGVEGDPGHQGYHGLKRTVTDDFICLGEKKGGLNEIRYEASKAGRRYYLWSSVTAPEALQAAILVSNGPPEDKSHTSPVITPAAVFVNGEPLADLAQPVALKTGSNPMLVRYDQAGRGHFVVRRWNQPLPKTREPLAMRWYRDSGVLPLDVYAGCQSAEWFRFRSAPGTAAIQVQANGEVQAWIDDVPMQDRGKGRFEALTPAVTAASVELRIRALTGYSGGALIPEPVTVETGTGSMALGDWSQSGILHNYSGGVRYRLVFPLSAEQAGGRVELDLGKVVATAEVHVNGRSAGIRVAPPWRLELTGLLKAGDNTLEVLVYNTLANHYQTIPSRYRGSPLAGLLGPVRLLSHDWPGGELYTGTAAAAAPVQSGAMPLVSRSVKTSGALQIVTAGGTLKEFDRTINSPDNLLRRAGIVKTLKGTPSHAGGGSGFAALLNGTVGNRSGSEITDNDGHTFVGMDQDSTLEIAFDTQSAPGGISVASVRSYAGHHDSRASQNYTLYASRRAEPEKFVKIAEVASSVGGGLHEVTIASLKNEPLITDVERLRFVFQKGPSGFNVYREIAVFAERR